MTLDELADELTAQKETIQHLSVRDRGQILLCAMDAPPDGCVICDGRVYDLTDLANERLRGLFQKIGNRYGGDGVNTFAVPELRGEFIRIFDAGRGVDNTRILGSAQGQATAMPTAAFITNLAGRHNHNGSTGDESQRHSHSASTDAQHQGGPNTFDSGSGRGVSPTAIVNIGLNDRGHTHAIAEQADHTHPITGGDAETRPRNIALAAFIRF